jgi:hypothetical protein
MKLSILTLALIPLIASWNTASADPVATHGMLLFGKNQSYISHLPMLHGVHAAQFVAEVKLGEIPRFSTPVLEKYQELLSQGKSLFTLLPSPFDLSRLMEGEIASFSAMLFDGHFEQGGQEIGLIDIDISQTLFSQKISTHNGQGLKSFLLFGSQGEYFAVNLIPNGSAMDQVLEVDSLEKFDHVQCETRTCRSPVQDSHLPQLVVDELNINNPLLVPVFAQKLGHKFPGRDLFTSRLHSYQFQLKKLIHHEVL